MENNPNENVDYKNLIKDIVDLSLASSSNNSIIYNFTINNNNIRSVVTLINQDGQKSILKKLNICLDNKYFNFINPLLSEFVSKNNIVLNDMVDLDKDNVVTYRLITDKNDMFLIDGLSFEECNYITDLVTKNRGEKSNKANAKQLINSNGVVNTWFIIILIALIGFVIFCSLYYV